MHRRGQAGPVQRWMGASALLVACSLSPAGQNNQLQQWWRALADCNEDTAFEVLLKLERSGPWAGEFLSRRLEPAQAPSRRQVVALVGNLSSSNYRIRNAAYQRLSGFGASIRELLQARIHQTANPEARKRLGYLIEQSRSLAPRNDEEWRTLRAIRVLERRADPQAKRVLARLAGGAQGARSTRWARSALARLGRDEDAADWAGWGANPQRTNCFATRALHRPARLAWQVDMGDFRYPATSMVIRENIAYMAVDHGDEGPHLCSYIYAIDLQSKKTLWRHGDLRTMVRTAPAVAQERLYYVSLHDSALVCLDVETGKELWRYRFSAGLQSQPLPAGPSVIVCGDDNTVHAVDTQFGKRVWKFDCQAPLNWSPALSGRAVLVPAGQLLYRLDLSTGKVVWKHEGTQQAGPPAIQGSRVFLMTSRDWRKQGRLVSLDLPSGRKVWQVEIPRPAPQAPGISGDHLYVLGEDQQQLWALRTDSGKADWKLPLDTTVAHTPAIADGMLYAVGRGDGLLIGVDLNRGQVAWNLQTGSRQLPGPPALHDGVLYFCSRRRTFSAVTEIPSGQGAQEAQAKAVAAVETILLDD